MDSGKGRSSSGSDSDPKSATIDEKKRKRMEANKESARRCRMKKQKVIDDLLCEVTRLTVDNGKLLQNIDQITERFIELDAKNNVLRAQIRELTDRLASVNSVLQIVEQVSGVNLDIPEIPNIAMTPRKNPCPVQRPVMANNNIPQG